MYEEFASLYDTLMRDVDYDSWGEYIASLLSEYGAEHGAKQVLDCACGTGEISLRLAKRGYRVTGVDLSPEMLQIAQQKTYRSGMRIPYVCQNICSLQSHNPANAIVCACDGVNYLTALEDVLAFFRSAHQALTPGGLLLFDISTAYKLEFILGEHIYGEDLKACTYLWENVFDPVSRLLEMRLHFFVPDGARYRRFDERHIQRAHTEAELRSLLEQAGFSCLDVFEAFTKNKPGDESQRTQWIARRNEK